MTCDVAVTSCSCKRKCCVACVGFLCKQNGGGSGCQRKVFTALPLQHGSCMHQHPSWLYLHQASSAFLHFGLFHDCAACVCVLAAIAARHCCCQDTELLIAAGANELDVAYNWQQRTQVGLYVCRGYGKQRLVYQCSGVCVCVCVCLHHTCEAGVTAKKYFSGCSATHFWGSMATAALPRRHGWQQLPGVLNMLSHQQQPYT